MKKFILLLFEVAFIVALASCSKAMDPQRDDRVDNEQSVYEYRERVFLNMNKAFYHSVYSGICTGGNNSGYMLSGYCDEAQDADNTSTVQKWYKGMSTASDFPLFSTNAGNIWEQLYQGIYITNAGLYYLNLPDLKPEYDQDEKENMISQYYALRAMDYLNLVKRFGGVPIVDKRLPDNHDFSDDKKSSFAACADFIIEDCNRAEAAYELPWFNGNNKDYPRISRGALAAIRSEIALYAASPLWANDYAGTTQYTWEKAATITRESLKNVLDNGGRLVDNTTSFPVESANGYCAYDKLFLSSYPWTKSWDTETLHQPYYYGNIRSLCWQYNGLPLDAGQSRCGACPTQEMVDAYDVVSADGTKAVPLLNLANPYNSDGTPNFNPEALALGYKDCDPAMYENRDPRFYGTIFYDGSTAVRNSEIVTIQTREGGNCGISKETTNTKHTVTGYYLRKFINADSGADNGNKDGFCRVFRLAELYLNFAEAAYMAYGADTPVDGMTARQAVNAVRSRVGLPGITETGDAFLLRLKNERRVELAFEEHRYFDVRRWSAPGTDLSATDKRVSGMNIDATGKYTRIFFTRNCFAPKYLKYPIPLDEVRKMNQLMGKECQNEGWN